MFPKYFKSETESDKIACCLLSPNQMQQAIWKDNHIESVFSVAIVAYDDIELMRLRNAMEPCSAADYKAITAKISDSILKAAEKASIMGPKAS